MLDVLMTDLLLVTNLLPRKGERLYTNVERPLAQMFLLALKRNVFNWLIESS